MGWIIPARAGFTVMCAPPWLLGGDHPRTRGVYRYVCPSVASRGGSSPHARGLRRGRGRRPARGRIIPARAGFTSSTLFPVALITDHPRTRGVYVLDDAIALHSGGSSPHARGLPPRDGLPDPRAGIIPARAGFTWPMTVTTGGRGRIIPARAGFTSHPFPGAFPARDHPRTRGVYLLSGPRLHPGAGSSPHARGLRCDDERDDRDDGIIPARAGFTQAESTPSTPPPDHPRTRGVYATALQIPAFELGSSPHARGLRGPQCTITWA